MPFVVCNYTSVKLVKETLFLQVNIPSLMCIQSGPIGPALPSCLPFRMHYPQRQALLGPSLEVKVKVAQLSLTLCKPIVCPWDPSGKNTGVVCHSLLQGIFPTQGLNLGLLHCRQILYYLSYKGSLHNCIPLSKFTEQ